MPRQPRRPRIDPNLLPPTPSTPIAEEYTIRLDAPLTTGHLTTGNELRWVIDDLRAQMSVISGLQDENEFVFTTNQTTGTVTSSGTITVSVGMDVKQKESEQVTNEFIEKYIQSNDWLKRLHGHLECCTYESFRFNSAPEVRSAMLKRAPSEFQLNTIVKIAQTSKNFSNKSYDMAFLKKCVSDFLIQNDFIPLTQPEVLASRVVGNFFNKAFLFDAFIGFNNVDGQLQPIQAQIPSAYIQTCPCCNTPHLNCDYMPNRRNLLQLSNAAHTRFFQKIVENNANPVIRSEHGLELYVRDHISRYVCEPCARDTSHNWTQCAHCNRAEEREAMADFPVGRGRTHAYCQRCFEDQMRNNMFITNNLEFQPQSLEINSRMRYVGCEFECYVKPTKLPSFNNKFVHQIKHDGSLSSANKGIPIEVVTQPLLDWRDEAITSICKELAGINVSVDNTCGGHIHVDSTGLNMNRQNMMRLRNLFRIYESAFFAVCSKGRLDNSRYCAPVALDQHQGPQDNRYMSMNLVSLQSHNTIEFRCFDGSADAEEWLSRIAFAEGFVNFAKDSINNMIETNDTAVLNTFTKDGGCDNWNNVLEGYNNNRARSMKEIIDKNGAALINLAGCRFKLKPSIISSLVKQHEKSWKVL